MDIGIFVFGTPRSERRHVPEPVDKETLDPETGDRQTVVDQLEQYEKIRRHVERQQEQEERRRQEENVHGGVGRADGKKETLNENDKTNERGTRKEETPRPFFARPKARPPPPHRVPI